MTSFGRCEVTRDEPIEKIEQIYDIEKNIHYESDLKVEKYRGKAAFAYSYASQIACNLNLHSARIELTKKALKIYIQNKDWQNTAFYIPRLAEAYHMCGSKEKRDNAFERFEKLYRIKDINEKAYFLYKKICGVTGRNPIPMRKE